MENQERTFDEGVRMAKSALLERVKANRETHRADYLEAKEAFNVRLVDWFDEQKKMALEGKQFAVAWTEVVPEDRTGDYDAVIDMLELSLDDEIILERREFRMYVRDEWSWSLTNKASFSTYTGKSYDG